MWLNVLSGRQTQAVQRTPLQVQQIVRLHHISTDEPEQVCNGGLCRGIFQNANISNHIPARLV